ncbi:hypothetical protein J1N35_022068 [Gossypium stocksii]|uniref:RING-type E3 ubiquitin transferase n=1 Tax=Gossypium stocksii TaxID=47602 RepID=A0A9D3VGW7_9ROSI|nr:hypothetical protein J1N35_022068 [Gossypium stocksii]
MYFSMRGGNPKLAQVPLRLGPKVEIQIGRNSKVSSIVLSQTGAQMRNRLVSEAITNLSDLLNIVGEREKEREGGGWRKGLAEEWWGEGENQGKGRDGGKRKRDGRAVELLDLEEHIGNVYTGLSEEAILGDLRRRQYQSLTMGPPAETEPCCICQEDFGNGYGFHFNCIKQRLVQKNSCPICKKTALAI